MILPSSFQGGEHTMGQLYQDAMARVRKFGKLDLFVMFTCNPKWKEITNALFPRQTAKDHFVHGAWAMWSKFSQHTMHGARKVQEKVFAFL
jgi:hypothetical protein